MKGRLNIRTGTPMQVERSGLGIRKSLMQACGAFAPTPRQKAKSSFHGRPPLKASDPITDAVLARMRGDHEFRGFTFAMVAAEYGITCERAYALLTYRNRGHIEAV